MTYKTLVTTKEITRSLGTVIQTWVRKCQNQFSPSRKDIYHVEEFVYMQDSVQDSKKYLEFYQKPNKKTRARFEKVYKHKNDIERLNRGTLKGHILPKHSRQKNDVRLKAPLEGRILPKNCRQQNEIKLKAPLEGNILLKDSCLGSVKKSYVSQVLWIRRQSDTD
jgi:hypothetical protein